MITAEEAKQLAGPTVAEKVELLGETIRSLASKGMRQCRTGYDHKFDEELWIRGGYFVTDDWEAAYEMLTAAGFRVTFHYEESQFVDMYTIIEW